MFASLRKTPNHPRTAYLRSICKRAKEES